jgi:integrase
MITERCEAFGVRVYRGQECGYEWIGTFKFRDYGGRRGARKAAEQAEAEARFRGNTIRRRTLTIEAYVERYLDDYRERQKDSAYVTASSRLAPFRREFGHLPLEDGAVDRHAASDWAREHRSCVPAEVALFNQAIKDDELTRNPFKGLSRKTRGRKDKRPALRRRARPPLRLRAAPARRLLMRALILFAAYSGMRPGELFALRWSDVDFAAMRINVCRRFYKGCLGPPKNGQERTIVLTPQARKVLEELPRRGELIFTAKRGGPLSQPLLSGYWTPLAALLGKRTDKHGRYELVDFYELRHRAA